MSRRGVRENIFKLLFHIEFNSREEMDEQIRLFYSHEENAVSDEEYQAITEKLNRILDHLPEIDMQLAEKTSGWSLNRLGKVDLTILRLAVYEIQQDETVDTALAINEAVELAKKYGQKESSGFVNGVLSKFAG